MVSCCLSGLRYKDFPFEIEKDLTATRRYREALRDKLIYVINEYGVTRFVTGLANEADYDLAETVLSLRDDEDYPIVLECIVLGTSQLKNLSENEIFRHNAVLIRADKRMKLSGSYLVRRRYKRDTSMLNNCDMLLAVTANKCANAMLDRAQKRNIPVETVTLSVLSLSR